MLNHLIILEMIILSVIKYVVNISQLLRGKKNVIHTSRNSRNDIHKSFIDVNYVISCLNTSTYIYLHLDVVNKYFHLSAQTNKMITISSRWWVTHRIRIRYGSKSWRIRIVSDVQCVLVNFESWDWKVHVWECEY